MTHSSPSVGVGRDAAARSALYRLLAYGFRFPTAEFFEALSGGGYRETLHEAINAASFARGARLDGALAWLSGLNVDFEGFCAEYIRLFEVGAARGKPPCPLYGGEYTHRPRLDVLEELVRFYSYFDLALSEADRELPDHITVELEFLHYLAFRENRALESGLDPSPFRRAQADFLERHPGNWIPLLREKLESKAPLAYFRGLVALTDELLAADLRGLRSSM